jgi:crotonobetainyl-CoA:carnitine CoA-transferase CaiB-like acyl-CoA transferase
MSAQGPLVGMRVLDLAHVMAGPTCGRMLADMGADVVKIESVGGDDTRRMLPPDIAGEAAAFMMMNRNKRGIVLDLKKRAARDVLKARGVRGRAARELPPRHAGQARIRV